MTRLIIGLVACAVAWLALAPAAWAQDAVSVSASVNGGSIVVQVSGSADPCSYCTSEAVQVEAEPTDGAPATSCWPSTPQATYPISTAGGRFSFNPSIPVVGGQTYEVCGFIVGSDYGLAPFPSAESQPVLITVPPSACAAGTGQALSLSAPRAVPINLRGLVDVQANASSFQTVSSATLTMQALSGHAFYTHTFTGRELNRLSNGNDVPFYVQFHRGDGPARITLSYVQTISDSSDQQCVAHLSRVVRPARAITPQTSIYSGASPSQTLRRKPARIVYSGDGGALLAGFGSISEHLRWTSWNTRQALARGDDWHDNCVPNCAQGRYSGYPVTIRLWRPQILDGHLVFTRMTVTYTGARPPYPAYKHRSLTYRLRYDSTYDTFFWI